MKPDPDALALLDDESLMARVALGSSPDSDRAFAALVTRHHLRGYQLGWRILHNQADAEDVVQEQFIKIWRGVARFDAAKGTFRGWFARLVTNGCIDRIRSLRLVTSLDAAMENKAFQPVDETPTPDRIAAGADMRRALDALLPRQRAVLALFYIEGFSMRDIADMLSTSTKAVESMLARGRAMLKLELGDDKQELCA